MVTRPPRPVGVRPRRRIPDQTFVQLNRSRRLAKSFERTTESDAAFITIAMIHLMVRRLR